MSGSLLQITQFPGANTVSQTDNVLFQQGPVNTPYTFGTVSQIIAAANIIAGSGIYGNQAWVPATSVWVPNGAALISRPQPYGGAALATAALVSLGYPAGSLPQVSGGFVSNASSVATYASRDAVAVCHQAAALGPLLTVTSGVTFDATHVYFSNHLSSSAIESIQPNMVIDTNHTPKFSGIITAVDPAGASITVSGWFQTEGEYVTAVRIGMGGTGYTVGDMVTMEGSSGQVASATCKVSAVGAGGTITSLTLAYGGSYQASFLPNILYPLYGGTGSNATGIVSTTVTTPGSTVAGQNPQSVTLFGSNPPPFAVYISPHTKMWARSTMAGIGSIGGVNPWLQPWIAGGGATQSVGDEIDAGNYTGAYIYADGIYMDYPTVWGLDVVNLGNARATAAHLARGDFANGFVSVGANTADSTVNSFASYVTGLGYTFRVLPGGSMLVGSELANYIVVTGAAAGSAPIINAVGVDSNVNLSIYGKGSGVVQAFSSFYVIENTIAAIGSGNNIAMVGAASGSAPTLFVNGGDTNIGLQINTMGSGIVSVAAPLQASMYFQLGSGGPTWTSGAGAPSSTQPVGSIYSNTTGTSGSRLYVSAGSGSWTAVSGV